MQKVSKQSLAMLALSILLAISIALTFTFANLTNTKTATGTITFTGEVGLIYSGITDTNEFVFNLEVDGNGNIAIANDNATDYNAAIVKLAPTSMPANVAVNITYADTSNKLSTYVKLKAATGLTLADLALSTDDYWTPESAGVKLADVVSLGQITSAADLVALSNVADGTLKFTVTFTASAVTGA